MLQVCGDRDAIQQKLHCGHPSATMCIFVAGHCCAYLQFVSISEADLRRHNNVQFLQLHYCIRLLLMHSMAERSDEDSEPAPLPLSEKVVIT